VLLGNRFLTLAGRASILGLVMLFSFKSYSDIKLQRTFKPTLQKQSRSILFRPAHKDYAVKTRIAALPHYSISGKNGKGIAV
jgi:hypothetical protein